MSAITITVFGFAGILLMLFAGLRLVRHRHRTVKPRDAESTKEEIFHLLMSHGPLDTSQIAVELMPDPDDDEGFFKLLNELYERGSIEIREPNDDPWLIVWGLPVPHFRRRTKQPSGAASTV